MNLKRSVFAVWQEYQGLGLVGGMGHAADLIRQIILLPLIFLLPNNWIRYIWHFGMLVLGTFGIYWGLPKIKKDLNEKTRILGSLFYLLNFGTIQIFWPPYEAFATFWGFFPWLIFSFLQILKKPSKKNWRLFVLLNLLATPSFYIQTLFVVYFLSLGTITFLQRKNKIITKSLKFYITIVLINSFWLLPFIYFLLTNIHHPRSAVINQMSSEETFMRNQKRGTIQDFLLLRGYYYDFPDAGIPLMQVWQNHLSKKWVLIIGYLLGTISLLGLISTPSWLRLVFLLSATALLSATPPFSWLNSLLRQFPLLDQVFRSPFTKFITPAAFSFSLLFALGINFLIKRVKKRLFPNLVHFCLFVFLILFSFPVFRGNFIYPKMQVKIPGEYFQLIEFFKDQPKTARIANLPQGSFWGWTFYNWGLRGSGFLWYGIEQPILDRAFDVWNLNNEQYYQDLNYAFQNQNLELLENVFDKYSVEFVIFDDNIIFPGEKVHAKQALKTKYLLPKSKRLKKMATFGDVEVYRFDHETKPYLSTSINSVLIPSFDNFKVKDSTPSAKTEFRWAHFARCNTSFSGEYSHQKLKENGKEFVRLFSKNDDSCISWWFPNLAINHGWLVEVEYRNISGHPPYLSIFDGEGNYKFLYRKLKKPKQWQKEKFIIPPINTTQKGIALAFNSTSFNQFATINDIATIEIYPVEFKNSKPQQIAKTALLESKSNIWLYSAKLTENKKYNYLVLPQSFDGGWLAFYLDGLRPIFFKNHVLINNWANGWEINKLKVNSEKLKVYLVFWPQILEFFGFGLLGITLFQSLKPQKSNK